MKRHSVWVSKNRDKVNAGQLGRYHKFQRRYYGYSLKKNYGLSLEWYDSVMEAQNGQCAICHEKEKLYVDHDHKSKKARGLLCRDCNFAIGLFKESPLNLEEARNYLLSHIRTEIEQLEEMSV